MTEKRFTFDNEFEMGIYDRQTGKSYDGRLGHQKRLYELLNDLHEENKQLNQMVDFYKYFQKDARELEKENEQLKEENKELKKQLLREETDKKRLMTPLMKYKSYSFDEIVEDILNEPYYDNWWEDGFYEPYYDNWWEDGFYEPYYDNWWEDGFYELCWDEYLKEKGFDGCDEE